MARQGRRLTHAVAATALTALSLAAPAQARTVELHVAPANRSGDQIAGEESVAVAMVRFPRGRAASVPYGAFWLGRRPAGSSVDCTPQVIVVGMATVAPLPSPRRDLQRGTVHRSRMGVALSGAGLSTTRTATGELITGRGKTIRTFTGVLHLRLPADVLPLYPRREIYVASVDLTGTEESASCPSAERLGTRAARIALTGIRLVLPPSYTPPPPPQPPPTMDLLAGGALHLLGAARGDEAGQAVGAAGDVNGDGRADALITAPGADRRKQPEAGAAYVVFGGTPRGPLSLGSLGPAGFRIDGPVEQEYEFSAAAVGDLDGDGLADVAVGAAQAGRDGNGVVYIVRGKRDGARVDLARRDDVLFTIGGGQRCTRGLGGGGIGEQVASAGDANGDGIGDIAVLAADNCGDNRATGAVYIVFGKHTAGDIDLGRLGSGGIAVRADGDAQLSDLSLAGAGDTNGDGLDDLVIGNVGYDEPPYAAIVPGTRTGGSTRVSQLATRITSGICPDLGEAVAGPGDVNGDGFADVAIGAPSGCNDITGRAIVVFGGPAAGRVDVDRLGTRGFQILSSPGFRVGEALGGAGDVNGDGLADLVLGYDGYRAPKRERAGAVTLVYGRSSTAPVRLASLGNQGLRWLGGERYGLLGGSVAGIGDFDGDGRPDVLAGESARGDLHGGAWVLPLP